MWCLDYNDVNVKNEYGRSFYMNIRVLSTFYVNEEKNHNDGMHMAQKQYYPNYGHLILTTHKYHEYLSLIFHVEKI